MIKKKEVDTLINLSRKVGQSFCDKGTFKETFSNQIVHEWQYKGNIFKMTFPKTLSDEIIIKSCYSEMRRKLRELNLETPSESSMRLVSNFARVEELVLLDELWEELGADGES